MFFPWYGRSLSFSSIYFSFWSWWPDTLQAVQHICGLHYWAGPVSIYTGPFIFCFDQLILWILWVLIHYTIISIHSYPDSGQITLNKFPLKSFNICSSEDDKLLLRKKHPLKPAHHGKNGNSWVDELSGGILKLIQTKRLFPKLKIC